MKKKRVLFLILGAALLLLVLILCFVFWPRAILPDKKGLKVNSVTYRDENITEFVDADAVVAIIEKYKAFHSIETFSTSRDDRVATIDLYVDTEGLFFHITLGKHNFYEYSTPKGITNYTIIDGDALTAELQSLFDQADVPDLP